MSFKVPYNNRSFSFKNEDFQKNSNNDIIPKTVALTDELVAQQVTMEI